MSIKISTILEKINTKQNLQKYMTQYMIDKIKLI